MSLLMNFMFFIYLEYTYLILVKHANIEYIAVR